MAKIQKVMLSLIAGLLAGSVLGILIGAIQGIDRIKGPATALPVVSGVVVGLLVMIYIYEHSDD